MKATHWQKNLLHQLLVFMCVCRGSFVYERIHVCTWVHTPMHMCRNYRWKWDNFLEEFPPYFLKQGPSLNPEFMDPHISSLPALVISCCLYTWIRRSKLRFLCFQCNQLLIEKYHIPSTLLCVCVLRGWLSIQYTYLA